MTQKNAMRGQYILDTMNDFCLNGSSFTSPEELYRLCRRANHDLSCPTFSDDLHALEQEGTITMEDSRVYLTRTWRYEASAAKSIANILACVPLPQAALPCPLVCGSVTLTEEQRDAVALALSNRLSLILGGAGTGKSTLIQAIVAASGSSPLKYVLAAPTGKAARNLTARTGLTARTVHSALGKRPNSDFLDPVNWMYTDLVIVDEASMLTLEMLAGILCRTTTTCRVVLVGDPQQLGSVGAGNVIPDLLALGIPHVTLSTAHRQDQGASALSYNVREFANLHGTSDLSFDGSFRIAGALDIVVPDLICREASRRYLAGESVLVLSPVNHSTALSVSRLNEIIRQQVNPAQWDKAEICGLGKVLREGDRVMITRNDRDHDCSNGDVGVFHVHSTEEGTLSYSVKLSSGREPIWDQQQNDPCDLEDITLAYALTVHKSQGTEYDTVIMPVSTQLSSMLYRNLLYTAISRARKQVILIGSCRALDLAMKRDMPPRRSMLVNRTNLLCA